MIPKETLAKLSPYLQAYSVWPNEGDLQPLPGEDANLPADPSSPAVKKQRELRALVEQLLAPSMLPENWQNAYLVDEDGNLYYRMRESGEFAKGLATVRPYGDSLCFSFTLRYSKPVRSANAVSFAAAIREALPEKVAAAVIPRSVVTSPTPGVNGPREFATVAALGRVGMAWDSLYLYQSKGCLIGVYQSSQRGAAPADSK